MGCGGVGSGGSSGRAADYQVRGPRCPPNTNGLLVSLDPAKVKAARKAMANYLIIPYANNIQDPNFSSPMLGLSVRPTFRLLGCIKSHSIRVWLFVKTFLLIIISC
ncbi:hypothetical protein PoB_004046600 [Plakobranchus ocellatus]|uniref:Uncharacterized protein n=1 Tax=Plakobranchus ocellatus TaxID=259542 RepID=A0AAV4AS62_9GAST|nr:hypothetical protein PoB_004046600 [Plakobranchus ocellatus]